MQDTSHKLFMLHCSLAGNSSTTLLCLATLSVLKQLNEIEIAEQTFYVYEPNLGPTIS